MDHERPKDRNDRLTPNGAASHESPLLPRPPLELGQVVATPGALAALSRDDILRALSRHAGGDWGDIGTEDAAENELSLREGFRILSAYRSAADGTKFWVITEADRSVTTVLLPDEY